MLAQLVVLGAVCAGMWFALRWLRAEFARVDGEMLRTQRKLGRLRRRTIDLRFDPATGHYHPVES